MPLSVLFVAAASPRVGAGHDKRTQLLADACAGVGMRVERVVLDPDDRAAAEDALRSAARGLAGRDVFVVDGPDAFVDACLEALPEGAMRVAFRMYGPGPAGAEDVAVTPSPHETREERAGTRLLVGGRDYLFVRPTSFAGRDQGAGERLGVLVTMGGADPGDATTAACEALEPLAAEHPVTVVVGSLNPRHEQIAARFGRRMRVLREGEQDFDDLLKGAAVAVINGGLTRYECVAAGTPFVAVSLDDRQAAYTEAVVASGFGRHAGLLSQLSPRAMLDVVRELLLRPEERLEMARRADSLVRQDAPEAFARALQAWHAGFAAEGRP